MLPYMDQVLRAFYQSTHWSTQNSYEDITATSRTLLDFQIPSAIHLQISNRSTPNTFNSLDFSTRLRINGSLSYLYSDAQQLDNFMRNSTDIPLQDATETYRQLQPNLNFYSSNSANGLNTDESLLENNKKLSHDLKFAKKSLYYGRMYYPSSDLEAMIIKRLNPQTQLMIKGVSSFKENLNVLTCYFQKYSHRNLQEWIFSTSDLLCGYRILHNFLTTPSKFNTSLYNNSSLSLGAEFWLGLVSLSPGCSTTLRYYTHSTNTGRPLTLTLSWNPLFGHISSTYSAKTGTNSTFCAKYDFNLYSIESNLSFGCEFWQKKHHMAINGNNNDKLEPVSHELVDVNPNKKTTKLLHESVPNLKSIDDDHDSSLDIPDHKQKLLNDLTYAFSSSLRKIDEERSTIEKFDNKINSSIFTSVWKLSTSLRDKTLKLLWEGKWRGFLISAGTELVFTKSSQRTLSNDEKNDDAISISAVDVENSNIPVFPTKFGIQFQYST
ncbi:hypothetical protein SMKI_01G0620 [Saccharomyces mikatae IFO 1815]|uniref:Mitochondrial distribution and morphology protein 10 n=1 Tax=Saccharomyces mikatae IFO 1815 TaxID=226126 RepID=A0AA35IV56_SACMI|nr:uncharacterized protein SMKI_01G0620 [Saccharomyces mikatae IFO 1815]CAI4037103.1 hypothetical protein SMKI_01G0620 [Saccharomyces mikatae IFO 1815]